MLRTNLLAAGFAAALGTAVLLAGPGTPAQGQPAQEPKPTQEITLTITGEPGTLPRYAVPDFIALSPDGGHRGRGAGRSARCCGTTSTSSASST